MFKSMRFSARNVALAYAAVSLALLALFATPLWYSWGNTIEQGRTELIEAEARRMTDLFFARGADALDAAIESRVGGPLEDPGRIILFTDASLVKRAGNLPAWPDQVSLSTGMQTTSLDRGNGMARVTLLHATLPGGYHLLVGRDVARFQKLENLFLYTLVGCGAMVPLLAVFGGLQIRRALLARVHDINRTTSAIVEGDLSRRLPALDGGDELAILTHTLNRMLEQIEHLVHSVRNVSNAIAHDLRTPLAELRSRLEELLLTRPSADETFAEIDIAIADVDRVIAIFNALLRLAEIDSGTRRSGFVEVDVAKIASEVAEFYQPVAELKEIALIFKSSDQLSAPGDPLLLAQAIGNLIENALKYAQQNGVITVVVRRRPDQAIEISVSDDGPGIPDEEKPKVVERFYRGDASRGTPGVGLGLSLVAAVARLHGGALELGDNHPGLRATILMASYGTGALPASDSPIAASIPSAGK
jgi:signal transduction histidine kinase